VREEERCKGRGEGKTEEKVEGCDESETVGCGVAAMLVSAVHRFDCRKFTEKPLRLELLSSLFFRSAID
jgi:hypothetical protein